MERRTDAILGRSGQSTVEYLLLLAVVISLAYTIINSSRFKELLGEGGTLGTTMRLENEWNYRFAKPRNPTTPASWSGANVADHPSYWNAATGSTHFVAPVKPYPTP